MRSSASASLGSTEGGVLCSLEPSKQESSHVFNGDSCSLGRAVTFLQYGGDDYSEKSEGIFLDGVEKDICDVIILFTT